MATTKKPKRQTPAEMHATVDKAKAAGLEPVVIARCVSCKKEKEVREFDVEPGDMPFCDHCGSVCIAERAEARKPK